MLAVLDASDQVVARFAYAGGGSVAPASRRPCLRAHAECVDGRMPCPCRLPPHQAPPFLLFPFFFVPFVTLW